MNTGSGHTTHTHRDLAAWREAIDLAVTAYRDTAKFPKSEAYGLQGQLRRAAVSVPANIAEGAARGSRNEFRRFLNVARASLSEFETLIILATKVGHFDGAQAANIKGKLDRVSRLIQGLITSLPRS